MFYKVRGLSASHDIILHYFNYKQNRSAKGLEGYCREIHTYDRLPFYRSLPITTPHIISSRNNLLLAEKLNMDSYPVLLEGIHCAGLIPFIKGKKVVLRMHNDDAEYYQRLAKTETGIFKKTYHANEARLLKNYQHKIPDQIPLACVSHSDMEVFKTLYKKNNLHYIPSFTPWQKFTNLEGSSDYCLYHGNLEVPENKAIASWLAENIFKTISFKLVIAGKGAESLTVVKHPNISLINNPADEQLDELIRNAQVNVLPSLNNTGLKLKLLHAVMMGRHVITNDAGVEGTDVKDAVTIANNVTAYQAAIAACLQTPFTKEMNHQREKVLEVYNNKTNAARLSALLY
jgi:glycosyltransferase involved in cell wall biosynthesis